MARKAPFRERTKRRIAIAGGRLRRTLSRSGRANRIVFLHMPKCGGTSLSEALYATVPLSERIGVIDAISTRRAAAILRFGRDDPQLCHEDLDEGHRTFALREGLMLQHMAWDTAMIHGHLLWSERADAHFGETYDYVTLLRDPVARTLSNYRMARRTGATEEEFGPWLEGPMARRQARVFLRYLSGSNDIAEDEVADALARARARLARFAVIGFLDRLPSFERAFAARYGVRPSPARLNSAPDRDGGPAPTDAQVARLRELCAPDMDLWEAARAAPGAAL